MLVNIRMPTFKNTLDILSNPWSNEFSQENLMGKILNLI